MSGPAVFDPVAYQRAVAGDAGTYVPGSQTQNLPMSNTPVSGPVWSGPGTTAAQGAALMNTVSADTNTPVATLERNVAPSQQTPGAADMTTVSPATGSPSPAIPDTTTNSTVSQLGALQAYTAPSLPTQANSADPYLQAYQAALGDNSGVTGVQGQLNALQQSQFLSHQGLEGQAIAMPFVTGQEAAVDKNVNQQQQTLTQQLALAQAKQQSGIDVSKAALDYYANKDSQANTMSMAQYNAQVQAQQQALQNAYNDGQLTKTELFTAQQNLANQQANAALEQQRLAATAKASNAITPYQQATLDQNAQQLAQQTANQNKPTIEGNAATGLYSVQNGVATPLQSPNPTGATMTGTNAAANAANPIDYTFHVGQETADQYNARIAAAEAANGSVPLNTTSPLSQPSASGSTAQPTATIQEYNYAKSQGYTGTLVQYQSQLANQHIPASSSSGPTGVQTAAQLKADQASAISGLAKRKGSDGYVSPQDYQTMKQAWAAQGLGSGAQFDAQASAFRNPNNEGYVLG